MFGRIAPIPVVLSSNETSDQYEEAFLRRNHPHTDVVKQRSQRINFAVKRAREVSGGVIPPSPSRYAAPASSVGPSEAAAAGTYAATSPGTSTRSASTGFQDSKL